MQQYTHGSKCMFLLYILHVKFLAILDTFFLLFSELNNINIKVRNNHKVGETDNLSSASNLVIIDENIPGSFVGKVKVKQNLIQRTTRGLLENVCGCCWPLTDKEVRNSLYTGS